MATQISLKPVGKLFGDAWKLYTKHMNVLALIAVIPLIFEGARMVLQPGFIGDYGYPLWVAIIFLTAAAIFAILHIVFVVIMPIGLIQASDEGHRGKAVEASAIYKKVFAEFIQYLFVLILVAIVTIGGGILFIIPGIIASIYLKFAVYAYVLEDKRGMDALVASAWYVRGSWWAIFGRLLLLAVALVLTGLVFAVIASLVLLALGFSAAVFSMIFQLFAFMILVPFAIVFTYVLYKDAKASKDGKSPDKSFVDESETLFIILLIVAAVAILIVFFMSTYARWNVNLGGQYFRSGYMNGSAHTSGMMYHRQYGDYGNGGYGGGRSSSY